MMTDPVADMLTRIMNGYRARLPRVNVPLSRMGKGLCEILRDEGYVRSVDVETVAGRDTLVVGLAYDAQQRPALLGARRVSKPGRRIYAAADDIPRVRGGLGVAVLTTSSGLMSDDEARRRRVGGEILCEVW